MYRAAVEKWEAFLAELEAPVPVPVSSHPNMETIYNIQAEEFGETRVSKLLETPTRTLRSLSIDTNRLAWCEVRSKGLMILPPLPGPMPVAAS